MDVRRASAPGRMGGEPEDAFRVPPDGGGKLWVTPTGVVSRRLLVTRRLDWDAAVRDAIAQHPAVALYLAHPERRAAIGTEAELERLRADLADA
jgi:hypothetical protein